MRMCGPPCVFTLIPRSTARPGEYEAAVTVARWLLFCVRFVHELVSWQTPGALSPDQEDLL